MSAAHVHACTDENKRARRLKELNAPLSSRGDIIVHEGWSGGFPENHWNAPWKRGLLRRALLLCLSLKRYALLFLPRDPRPRSHKHGAIFSSEMLSSWLCAIIRGGKTTRKTTFHNIWKAAGSKSGMSLLLKRSLCGNGPMFRLQLKLTSGFPRAAGRMLGRLRNDLPLSLRLMIRDPASKTRNQIFNLWAVQTWASQCNRKHRVKHPLIMLRSQEQPSDVVDSFNATCFSLIHSSGYAREWWRDG